MKDNRRLLLLRHGPAGDRAAWKDSGRSDADRPLTPKGVEKTRLAVRGLRRFVRSVDLIATSPFVRAAETAALLADAYPLAELFVLDALAHGKSPSALAGRLGKLRGESIAVVGHEPELGLLCALLTGAPSGAFFLKKAGAALLSFAGEPRPGTCRLDWCLPPRALRSLAYRS